MVRDIVLGDIYYQNACKNSDRENAILESRAAVLRAVRGIDDPTFMRAFYDNTAFHNRLCDTVFQQTYPALATPVVEAEPVPQGTSPEPDQAAPDFDPLAPAYKGVATLTLIREGKTPASDLSILKCSATPARVGGFFAQK